MLIHCDGFDHYGNRAQALKFYPQFPAIYDANGRTGACFRFDDNNMLSYILPQNNSNNLIAAFAFKIGVGSYGRDQVRLLQMVGAGGTEDDIIGILTLNPGLGFCTYDRRLFTGTAPTFTSPNNLWQANVWNFLEVMYVNVSGSIVVRINGVEVWNVPALAWKANIPVTFIQSTNYAAGGMYIDDFHVLDSSGTINNAFLGDRRCRTFLPTADSATQQWQVVGAASGAAATNGVPATETSYLQGNAVGNRGLFLKGNVPDATSSIAGIGVFLYAGKSDAGVAGIKGGFTSTGGVINTQQFVPGVTAAYFAGVLNTNGAGVGFTRDEFNNANSRMVLDRTA